MECEDPKILAESLEDLGIIYKTVTGNGMFTLTTALCQAGKWLVPWMHLFSNQVKLEFFLIPS